LSEGFSVVYADIEGEMIVGGVFLRLFVANPGWVLRKPKEFITELLEKWSEIVSVSNPNVTHHLRQQFSHNYKFGAGHNVRPPSAISSCFYSPKSGVEIGCKFPSPLSG